MKGFTIEWYFIGVSPSKPHASQLRIYIKTLRSAETLQEGLVRLVEFQRF